MALLAGLEIASLISTAFFIDSWLKNRLNSTIPITLIREIKAVDTL